MSAYTIPPPRHVMLNSELSSFLERATQHHLLIELPWSGRPGSNRRPLPWQGSVLPLNYTREKQYSMLTHKVGHPIEQMVLGATELHPHYFSCLLEATRGIEPLNRGFVPQLALWRPRGESNPWIRVLQTLALPLGYSAISLQSARTGFRQFLLTTQGRDRPLPYHLATWPYVRNLV